MILAGIYPTIAFPILVAVGNMTLTEMLCVTSKLCVEVFEEVVGKWFREGMVNLNKA